MSRPKVANKNINVSVSLPKYQTDFIIEHKDFVLSKFVQLNMDDYMNVYYEIQELLKKEDSRNEKTVG